MESVKIEQCYISTFSYPSMVEEVLFWSQIFEVETSIDLPVLMSPQSENHIFIYWYVCVSYRITRKQITVKTSNSVFYISVTRRCNLIFFMKIGKKIFLYRGTQTNFNPLLPAGGISCYCILILLDSTKYRDINIRFSCA